MARRLISFLRPNVDMTTWRAPLELSFASRKIDATRCSSMSMFWALSCQLHFHKSTRHVIVTRSWLFTHRRLYGVANGAIEKSQRFGNSFSSVIRCTWWNTMVKELLNCAAQTSRLEQWVTVEAISMRLNSRRGKNEKLPNWEGGGKQLNSVDAQTCMKIYFLLSQRPKRGPKIHWTRCGGDFCEWILIESLICEQL